ncbi:protein of unknown function (plasmid) [Magnetospirillum sp. XM-1]|uniref:hypothetical protein n=1 Tax=Magnetospirillum sp. XM-1 TaxID=1663591 RepID=UPI00073DF1BF|nr:hypothetical protein [Magnetospirillum sp. XM-1]CUW41841.1 protein of unknown function [Magnetospirillum sp. XM-1]
MRINALIIVLFAVALSACASTPSVPLAKRLEGMTPEERQETLRRACLTEADWDRDQTAARLPANAQHRYRDSNTTRETRHLKELCREMADLPAIKGRSPIETKRRADLAEKCRRETDDHLDLRSKESAAHMARVQEICEAMTGFDLPTQAD